MMRLNECGEIITSLYKATKSQPGHAACWANKEGISYLVLELLFLDTYLVWQWICQDSTFFLTTITDFVKAHSPNNMRVV